MIASLRQPGEYCFWTVQYAVAYQGGNPVWRTIGSDVIDRIPHPLRWNVDSTQKEPFLSFGVRGRVWMESGNFGFKTFGPAVELMVIVTKACPEHEFRVAQIQIKIEVVTAIPQATNDISEDAHF